MDLYEYQAKEIFRQYGIPTPAGVVISDPAQVPQAFAEIGSNGFAVAKAQVLTGGRGKAGAVKVTDSVSRADAAVRAIFSMKIKGLRPRKVLLEEKLNIQNEYFISITIDPEESLPAVLVSPRGGIDIEEIARNFPSSIGKYIVEPEIGLPAYAIAGLLESVGFPRNLWGALIALISKLYKIFMEKEATLIESNPLVETSDGALIAADARLNVDDNALFRHPDLSEFKKEFKEMVLKDQGVDYIDLENGEIGLLCVGAGMTMLTMDLVAQLGSQAKCFLDISHGVNPKGFTAALKVLAQDPGVKIVLVNMFGGLTRMDEIARSMLAAIDDLQGSFPKPALMRLQGTNAEEGQRIMREAGYQVFSELEDTLSRLEAMLKEVR
jgi:succinyl-CoA synthetase beta subunit